MLVKMMDVGKEDANSGAWLYLSPSYSTGFAVCVSLGIFSDAPPLLFVIPVRAGGEWYMSFLLAELIFILHRQCPRPEEPLSSIQMKWRS